VSDRLLRATEGRLRYRPALAPAPVLSETEIDREDQSPATRQFRDRISSAWASNGSHFARRLCEILGTRPANPAFRRCALAASTV
jgi:hypothetical protein